MNRLLTVMLSAICAAGVALSIAGPACAADSYVFGTSLVFTSPTSLNQGNSTWEKLLPKEYSYSVGQIVDDVNAARAKRGVKAEIDVAAYPVALGYEQQNNGAFEYNIDFVLMTPDDVDVILKKYPLKGKLATLPHTLRPISTGFFNGDSIDGGQTVTLTILGDQLNFTENDSIASIHAAVAKTLASHFGKDVKFDISFNHYETVVPGSTNSYGVYVTVYMNGAEKTVQTGEGGE